jgi:hypothetical protein
MFKKSKNQLPAPQFEFLVKKRDDHGRPSVVGSHGFQKSELDLMDEKKLPKQRLAERRAFKQKDQMRLQQLFWLPKQHAQCKIRREEVETAVQKEVEKERERELKLKAEEAAKLPAVALASPSLLQGANYRQVQQNSSVILYTGVAFAAIFFSMAVFRSFRDFVIKEFIVRLLIESLSPPLLEGAFYLGEQSQANFPLLTDIIVSFYNVLGFWPLAIGCCWLFWKFWDLVEFSSESTNFALWTVRQRIRPKTSKK